MTDVPRTLPKGAPERLSNVVNRVAPGARRGDTRYYRPVQQKNLRRPGQEFNLISAARWSSTDTDTLLDNAALDFDPFGNADDYFTYTAPADFTILSSGLYQVSVSATFEGMTPGDLGYVLLGQPGPESPAGTFFGQASGDGFASASTLPFYIDFDDASVGVTWLLPSGTITGSSVYLVKLA